MARNPQSASVHLVVTEAFGPYQRGDRIEDAAEIERIQAGDDARRVVAITPASQE